MSAPSATESSSSVLEWLQLSNREPPDVVISCLVAITASTLLALHLDVPAVSSRRHGASRPSPSYPSFSTIRRCWSAQPFIQLRRQLLWAAAVIVAPELLVSLAFGDWRAATHGHRMLQAHGRGNVSRWTRTHAVFANMGGLAFEMRRDRTHREIPDSAPFRETSGDGNLRQAWKEIFTRTTFHDGLLAARSAAEKFLIWWKPRRLVREMETASRSTINQAVVSGTMAQKTGIGRRSAHATLAAGQSNIEGATSGDPRVWANEPRSTSPNATAQAQRPAGESQAGPSTARPTLPDLGEMDIADTNLMESSTDEGIATGLSPLQVQNEGHAPGNQGGEQVDDPEADMMPLPQDEIAILYLNAGQIAAAQILGILDDGPDLSEEDIADKSKSNGIFKGIEALRLLWFAARIMTQMSQGKALNQLELATLTYVVVALLAYVFYWSKPQGVERPLVHRVEISSVVRPVTDQDIEYLKWFAGMEFFRRNFIPPFGMDHPVLDPRKARPTGVSLSWFCVLRVGSRGVVLFDDDFAGIVTGTLFGCLYCLGWNISFPTTAEQWAWRASSIVITASLIPYSIANGICTMMTRRTPTQNSHIIHTMVLYALLSMYMACRVFMLVETVRTVVL